MMMFSTHKLTSLALCLFTWSEAVAQDLLDFQSDQQDIRCVGVTCPSDRPRCIVEGAVTRCVPLSTSGNNNNRLSRRPRPIVQDPAFFNNQIGGSTGATTTSTGFPALPQSNFGSSIPNQNNLGRGQNNRGSPIPQPGALPSQCYQSAEPGNCFGYFPRYYYNSLSGQCESFTYGGCGGNTNNFDLFQDCVRTCALPAATGGQQNQRGNNRRGSSNTQNPSRNLGKTDDNAMFNQNSLLNRNLFLAPQDSTLTQRSRNDILSRQRPQFSGFAPGGPPPPPRACILNADPGPCEALIPRFFYNQSTKKCEPFNYGGCQGNANNFQTLQDCQRTCNYFDSFVQGQSNGLNTNQLPNTGNRNQASQNRNNQRGISQNRGSSPTGFAPGAPPPPPRACLLPVSRGPCLAIVQRYYYDTNTKTCQQFNYGGCGGNQNNFRSLQECTQTCNYFDTFTSAQNNGNPILSSNPQTSRTTGQSQSPFTPSRTSGFASGAPPPPPRVCLLRRDPGPCFGIVQRFFYNTNTKQCEPFEYGGCAGNGNNFESMSQCRQTCDYYDDYVNQQRGVNLRQQPAGTIGGSGQSNSPVPVGNSALTPSSSVRNNQDLPDACFLDKKTGPCRALFRRYFYNKDTGRCEQFTYGGCQPNENNFMTQQDCKRICGGKPSLSSGTRRRNNGNPFTLDRGTNAFVLTNGNNLNPLFTPGTFPSGGFFTG